MNVKEESRQCMRAGRSRVPQHSDYAFLLNVRHNHKSCISTEYQCSLCATA